MKALEERAEVESLDELHHKRRELVKQAAPIRAAWKCFDARRKQRRNSVAALLLVANKEKLSETALERVASADPRYVAYLDDAELSFAELEILEEEILSITERVQSRQTELNTYNAELRLSR